MSRKQYAPRNWGGWAQQDSEGSPSAGLCQVGGACGEGCRSFKAGASCWPSRVLSKVRWGPRKGPEVELSWNKLNGDRDYKQEILPLVGFLGGIVPIFEAVLMCNMKGPLLCWCCSCGLHEMIDVRALWKWCCGLKCKLLLIICHLHGGAHWIMAFQTATRPLQRRCLTCNQ